MIQPTTDVQREALADLVLRRMLSMATPEEMRLQEQVRRLEQQLGCANTTIVAQSEEIAALDDVVKEKDAALREAIDGLKVDPEMEGGRAVLADCLSRAAKAATNGLRTHYDRVMRRVVRG